MEATSSTACFGHDVCRSAMKQIADILTRVFHTPAEDLEILSVNPLIRLCDAIQFLSQNAQKKSGLLKTNGPVMS